MPKDTKNASSNIENILFKFAFPSDLIKHIFGWLKSDYMWIYIVFNGMLFTISYILASYYRFSRLYIFTPQVWFIFLGLYLIPYWLDSSRYKLYHIYNSFKKAIPTLKAEEIFAPIYINNTKKRNCSFVKKFFIFWILPLAIGIFFAIVPLNFTLYKTPGYPPLVVHPVWVIDENKFSRFLETQKIKESINASGKFWGLTNVSFNKLSIDNKKVFIDIFIENFPSIIKENNYTITRSDKKIKNEVVISEFLKFLRNNNLYSNVKITYLKSMTFIAAFGVSLFGFVLLWYIFGVLRRINSQIQKNIEKSFSNTLAFSVLKQKYILVGRFLYESLLFWFILTLLLTITVWAQIIKVGQKAVGAEIYLFILALIYSLGFGLIIFTESSITWTLNKCKISILEKIKKKNYTKTLVTIDSLQPRIFDSTQIITILIQLLTFLLAIFLPKIYYLILK